MLVFYFSNINCARNIAAFYCFEGQKISKLYDKIPTKIPTVLKNPAGIRDWKKPSGSRVFGIPSGSRSIPADAHIWASEQIIKN